MKPLPACLGSLLIASMIVLPDRASPQDPRLSYAPDFVTLTPDGSAGFTVHVEDETGPLEGAMVEVEFSIDAEELVAWTGDQIHPILTGLTDIKGEVVFFISGGGCWYCDLCASFIVQVRANGIVIAEPHINSPDAVNPQGRVPVDIEQNICEGGRTSVGLADAVFHTRPLKLGLVEPCSKFSAPFDATVGLTDAIFVTPYIKKGVWGTCQ